MPHFVFMNEEDVLKAVEGYSDELSSEARLLSRKYDDAKCPNCAGSSFDRLHVHGHVFSENADTFLPRSILRCRRCKVEFDVHSGVILKHSGSELWNLE